MIPKLILVMYMLVGRGEIQVQYVVRYSSEAACKIEEAKHQPTGFFRPYPVQYAVCTFDAGIK